MSDQRCTPFSQNIADLWSAIKGEPREDGRKWLDAVGHEVKNVILELYRKITGSCPK